MDFQDHFIKDQANLWEWQQTSRQGGYGSNKLVGTEDIFTNLAQETAEYRAAVTNLTVANMNLTIQVEKCANHLTTKEFVMTSMQKKQPVAGGNEKTKNQAVWPDHQENQLKTAQ